LITRRSEPDASRKRVSQCQVRRSLTTVVALPSRLRSSFAIGLLALLAGQSRDLDVVEAAFKDRGLKTALISRTKNDP
jgi:hypothetical protein